MLKTVSAIATQIISSITGGLVQFTGPAAGTTRVITVPNANATMARTDASQSFTGDQTLGTGNLIQGTAGKGFNFTANTNAPGMTSELLNWYEEGTFTPTYTGWSSDPTLVTAKYTRTGRMVYLNCIFFGGTTTGGATIGSLPFAGGYQGAAVSAFTATNPSAQITGVMMDFATSITNINAVTVGGNYWTLSISYSVS
jgi:hypothetical protein